MWKEHLPNRSCPSLPTLLRKEARSSPFECLLVSWDTPLLITYSFECLLVSWDTPLLITYSFECLLVSWDTPLLITYSFECLLVSWDTPLLITYSFECLLVSWDTLLLITYSFECLLVSWDTPLLITYSLRDSWVSSCVNYVRICIIFCSITFAGFDLFSLIYVSNAICFCTINLGIYSMYICSIYRHIRSSVSAEEEMYNFGNGCITG